MEDCLLVTPLRKPSGTRVVHQAKSQNHVLQVAFNNFVLASEKRFDGKRLLIKPGRIVAQSLYLPAGSELNGWSLGAVDALRLEISPSLVQEVCDWIGRKPRTALQPGIQLNDPITWHLACLLMADLRNGCPGGMLLRDSVGQVLAQHVAIALQKPDACSDRAPGALAPARLRAVVEYVQAHLHCRIRLAELASLARLSPFHFTRAFKAATGKSPYQYVVEQRLASGCRLLEATNLTVAEIAATTGFDTVTGFTKSFRSKWGVTPRAYRRSTRSLD